MDKLNLPDTREGYLIFLIGGKEYGINVKIVSSVLNPKKNFPKEQSVIIETSAVIIDDDEIPFIDFYELLDVKSRPPKSIDTRIVITDLNNHKFAFYVERVKEFISTNTDSIVRFESSEPRQSIIRQYIIMPGRNILLPDFDKIFVERI